MSLFKQMVIMLTLFLGIVLASVMVLNFKSATEFVQNQLYTDAKNTAHSLGLSLSKVADPTDTSTMDTMINAIFDSGYHEEILLTDMDGHVIYQRKSDMKVLDVPQWFIDCVSIQSASATSNIMIGWTRFGTLKVSGHTGNAYRQLYATLIDLIQTFLLLGAVVFILLYLLLKVSLKSLERIRDQAKGIIENKFILQEKVPFTTEFRSATMAMNTMVSKVKDIFERENETLRRYHELLYKDSETKLYNRRYITAKLPDYLQSHTSLSSGVYIMLSLDGIDRLKREMGYQQDMSLLNLVASELKEEFENIPNVLLARMNESDFLIILPEQIIAAIHPKTLQLLAKIHDKMSGIDSITSYVVLGCGLGNYTEFDTLKSLFSRADHGVMEAKSKGNFVIDVSMEEHESLVLGRDEWRTELLQSIEESRMVLAFQSVVQEKDGGLKPLHEEIFLRLLDKEGTIHNAGYFIPVATSLGLADTLDRYMIEKVFNHLKEKYPAVGLGINISGDFVKKHSNIEWLSQQLSEIDSAYRSILCFEISNTVAFMETQEVYTLSETVKTFGCRFGIDHFVMPDSGAEYLQAIRPNYLKANAEYLKDMLYDTRTGHIRESLNNLTKSLGIEIIAIGIETSQQMDELQGLGIGRFQGSFVSPVALLK